MLKDMIRCVICFEEMEYVFSAEILNKHEGRYFCCPGCGYLTIKDPYWLEEAYSSAIADTDTGLMARNISISNQLSSLLFWMLGERGRGRYLDYAGGYGVLTRLMRDFGFDFYWKDRYCENILAHGFDYKIEYGACEAVTAIEVLEHLVAPVSYIDEILRSARADTLIFTTELYEGSPPDPRGWWYYSLPTGQHIGFFQYRTFVEIGKKMELNFYSANGVHILTKRRLSQFMLKIVTNPYFSKIGNVLVGRLMRSKTMGDHQRLLDLI